MSDLVINLGAQIYLQADFTGCAHVCAQTRVGLIIKGHSLLISAPSPGRTETFPHSPCLLEMPFGLILLCFPNLSLDVLRGAS